MKRPKTETIRRYWALIGVAFGFWAFALWQGQGPLLVVLAAGPAVFAGLWMFLVSVELDEAEEARERLLDALEGVQLDPPKPEPEE